MVFSFTVLTREPANDATVERVYSVLDDATCGSENCGCLAVGFDRQADSLEEALRGALQQLRGLGLAVDTVTIDSDSVAALV